LFYHFVIGLFQKKSTPLTDGHVFEAPPPRQTWISRAKDPLLPGFAKQKYEP